MPLKRICIHDVMSRLDKVYESLEAPIITFLASMDSSPFKILIATVLSLRTLDTVTARASISLFEAADTPEKMVLLSQKQIEKLIYPVGFYPTKARRIIEICHILIRDYNSQVPANMDDLLAFPGVGRKTANLVLVEGFNIPAVCVDSHVHRISNRIGFVATKTPGKTEAALRKDLPVQYWIRYNEILVAFGQVVCRPLSPFCSRCDMSDICPKIGVVKHR